MFLFSALTQSATVKRYLDNPSLLVSFENLLQSGVNILPNVIGQRTKQGTHIIISPHYRPEAT